MNTLKEQYIAEGAIVKGNVKLGKDASVWYHATIRGDSNSITIGDETNIQDNVVYTRRIRTRSQSAME